MEMDEKEKRSYLKDEYLFLQNQYEDFDRRSLTIKGWIGSGSIAVLAFSYNNSYKDHAIILPIIAISMSLVFWYLEAHWKLFQYALSDRIRTIEAHFRGDRELLDTQIEPFQIYNSWFRTYVHDHALFQYEIANGSRPASFRTRLLKCALQRFVFLPYVPIVLLSLLTIVVISA